jgi:hypothetical protein
MARYVEGGVLDAGITGRDWVFEYDAQVHVANELVYSKASLRPTRLGARRRRRLAGEEARDLHGKRIATELVGYTKRWFAERNIDVQIEFSWGATEAKVAEGSSTHRRGHRDGLDDPRARPAHRLRALRVGPAAHREPRRVEHAVEAREDRADRPACSRARSAPRPRSASR